MKNKIIISLLISFFVASGSLLAYRTGLFQRAEDVVYDAKARLYRATASPPGNIKVILVDDATVENDVVKQKLGRWPWPRAIWADLLRFLSLGEARMVLFDILFSEPDRQNIENDAALVGATSAAGNVVHSMMVKHEEKDVEQKYNIQLGRPLPAGFVERHALKHVQGALQVPERDRSNNYVLPIDRLWEASAGAGIVEFTPDEDGVLRRTRPLREYQGVYFPVLGLAPFIGKDSNFIIGKKAIQINDRILPIDIEGSYLINMYGIDNVEPISIGGIFASLAKIDSGEIEDLVVRPEEFKDSIVFVGVSAVGGYDLKATPLATRAPGVLLHASIAGNYLQQDFLMPPDRRLTVLSVLVGVVLTTAVVFFSKQLLVRASLPALMLVGYAWYSFAAFRMHAIVETVPFVFATVTSGFLSFAYLTFTESLEKRRVSQLFTQYVNKDVLNEVLHNYKEYLKSRSGQKVEITVLFSDIRGFTTISETTPPDKIVEMLNIHFSHMADIILKHNGTIDKYIGDAIMAFWGAPVKDELHAERAVRAGMEMIQELDAVNRELKAKGLDMEIKIGVGINTGGATIGEIGSEKKKNYTIVGDTVNLASRLESITKEYKTPLIYSEYTHDRIKDRISGRVLGNVKVKGREQPVNIYTTT